MQARQIVLGIGLLAVGAAWYAFRPERLLVNRTVNEPLLAPGADYHEIELVGRGLVPPPAFTALEIGHFQSGAHETAGQATVYRLEGGKRLLRLTTFRTSNGPDVHVYLVAAANVAADDDVKRADVIDLGEIKGNIGDQNYELPAGTDLSKYRSVSVWCKRFGVNFGSARLAPA